MADPLPPLLADGAIDEALSRRHYPFSAMVGQERVCLGLLIAVVDPSLGGVLVSGTKGTGKSTAVRALRALLPELEAVAGCPYHCPPDDPQAMDAACRARHLAGEALPRARVPTPFVELPLNATEDRVAGTLDIERALRGGERRFEPGLLAAAHRGFLYVDEVNLLDDHLVDLLLDAAVSGVHVVEREGISHVHPARFVLLGTMNPEEGSLRPQFLDRFALFVSIPEEDDLERRREVARRRLAFDHDPAAFAARWAPAQAELSARLARARASLASVAVPDDMIDLAVRLSAEARTRGHRAEIATLKAARALAALAGRPVVESEAVAEAARFALPHRMSAGPLDTPDQLARRLKDLIRASLGGGEDGEVEEAEDDEDVFEQALLSRQIPGSSAAGSVEFSVEKKSPKSSSPTG
jgi:magnesium chelatase subunit I